MREFPVTASDLAAFVSEHRSCFASRFGGGVAKRLMLATRGMIVSYEVEKAGKVVLSTVDEQKAVDAYNRM